VSDPNFVVIPRYWIPREDAPARAGDIQYLIGFRNVISAISDSRSLVSSAVPVCGVGNSMPLVIVNGPHWKYGVLLACLNSLVLDYLVKQKASGANLNFFIMKQLAVPSPEFFVARSIDSTPLKDWILSRVAELVAVTPDLGPFSSDMIGSDTVFSWDAERRFQLQCELDALFFHVYGISYDDAEYILDSFNVLRNAEMSEHGSFRTKDRVLSLYKSMDEKLSENLIPA
jgi:hypothetical protein